MKIFKILSYTEKNKQKTWRLLNFLLFRQKLVHTTKFKPQLEINARRKTQRFEIQVNSVHGAIPKEALSKPEPNCELKRYVVFLLIEAGH